MPDSQFEYEGGYVHLDDLRDETSEASGALRAALVAPLPTAGSYTYNTDGTVATDPDGNSYTYNNDGTLHTITKNGTTRTFSYNGDGTLASVA